ncbi:unnamed protein product [Oppiella nova]|uniref:Uncharacterized protein n=1 Tax=Oppiella nova TaxID=334625 RepID=A0A7R9QI96_9ACAR|nr:unnamed protein product [Oppiella nova]CAG2166372.1 unnamed protein product [Oppiella nova]
MSELNQFNVSQLFDHFDVDNSRGLHSEQKQSIEFSKSLVVDCENVTNKLTQIHEKQKRNKFEIIGEEEVVFKMIRSNATIVAQDLDQLSKQLKKFLCLNDNIDHQKADRHYWQLFWSLFQRKSI